MGRDVTDLQGGDGGGGMAVTVAQPREILGGVLRPLTTPKAMLEAQQELSTIIAETLKEGTDFGLIPGTQEKSLLQPGAESICMAMGVRAEYDIVEQEIDHDRIVQWTKRKKRWEERNGRNVMVGWDEESGTSEGLYRFVIRCRLIHRDSGIEVGSAIGACTTLEGKYIDRPRESENTVLQMAQKRAFIRVTRNAFGLSRQFTQDVETGTGDPKPKREPREPRGERNSGGGQQSSTRSQPRSSGGAFDADAFLDSKAAGNKPAGRTWREMCEQDRSFVRYAVREWNSLSDEQKQVLTEMCDDNKEQGMPAKSDGGGSTPPPAKRTAGPPPGQQVKIHPLRELRALVDEAYEAKAITNDQRTEWIDWIAQEPVDDDAARAVDQMKDTIAKAKGANGPPARTARRTPFDE